MIGDFYTLLTCINVYLYLYIYIYIRTKILYLHINIKTKKWFFKTIKLQAFSYTHQDKTQKWKRSSGTSLVVQWLRLDAPITRGSGLIPGQKTRFHMPQQKILHAATGTWGNHVNKYFFKKKEAPTDITESSNWYQYHKMMLWAITCQQIGQPRRKEYIPRN